MNPNRDLKPGEIGWRNGQHMQNASNLTPLPSIGRHAWSPPPVSPPSAYPQPMKPNPPSAYPQPMNPNPPAAQSNFQPMNPNPLAVQSNFQPMNPNPPFADSQPMAMSEQEMTDVLTQMLNTQHHLIMVQEQKVLQWQMRIMRAQIEQIIMNNLRRLNDPDNQG
ncbi:uncharacterized protein LOC134855031 [Symsagittifera roscoffensis]|uniref:uncharacterized protein LOC134855031 n=1 Tax=Symsagittifera roscoffensis TaxID=84072 RepID=UPI00307B9DF8